LPGSSIIKKRSPEEQELEDKIAELKVLEEQLTHKELELATIQGDLISFERIYLHRVGVFIADLDELIAQISELIAHRQPSKKKQAHWARTQAKEAREAAGSVGPELAEPFLPSDELKAVFREVAKRIHPDLANSEEERSHCEELMKEANQAYRDEDINRLRSILKQWEIAPERVVELGVGAELVRVIRKIALVKERLQIIENEINLLIDSDLFILKLKVEEAKSQGFDLFEEMASEIKNQIYDIEERLNKIITNFSRSQEVS